MGDGQRLPIPEIETLNTYMEDVHLVVLSACQTALGGPDEEGLEIAGLGYYFLKSRAAVVMASLWNVSDSSTSQLMQQFYTALARGTATHPVTTAEALRQAQLDMLHSHHPGAIGDDRFTYVPQDGDASLPTVGVAHPYYWAPFILIGNSL
jgi:CHAT domain-containing protein